MTQKGCELTGLDTTYIQGNLYEADAQLRGHPSLSGHQAGPRNERLIFPFVTNPHSADTSIKRTRTLKKIVLG